MKKVEIIIGEIFLAIAGMILISCGGETSSNGNTYSLSAVLDWGRPQLELSATSVLVNSDLIVTCFKGDKSAPPLNVSAEYGSVKQSDDNTWKYVAPSTEVEDTVTCGYKDVEYPEAATSESIKVFRPNIGNVSALIRGFDGQLLVFWKNAAEYGLFDQSHYSFSYGRYKDWNLDGNVWVSRAIYTDDKKSIALVDIYGERIVRVMESGKNDVFDIHGKVDCFGESKEEYSGLAGKTWDDIFFYGENTIWVGSDSYSYDYPWYYCAPVAIHNNSYITATPSSVGGAKVFHSGLPTDIYVSANNDVFVFATNRKHAACLSGCSDVSDINNWSYPDIPVDEDFVRVSGTSSNNVWAVGNLGAVIHFDGSKWSAVDSGTEENLRALWVDDGENTYIGGENGTFKLCKTSTLRCEDVL